MTQIISSVRYSYLRSSFVDRDAGHAGCKIVSIARSLSCSTQLKDEGTCL